jgi:hypothetical protein
MADANSPQNLTNPSVEPKPTKQKWSLKKKLIAAFGVIAVVVVALVLIVNSATAAPVKVSNQLVANIQAKNATLAYNLLSKEAKDATDPQEFLATVNQIGPILTGKPDMQSKEVNAQTGSASTAKVVYDIQGNDGLVYVFTVNLVKEGSDWKVLNFESTKKSGGSSGSSSSAVSVNKEVQDKCMAQVKDTTFCKFAGAFGNVGDYSAVMTSVADGNMTTATMAISSGGNSSMTVKENGTTSATIVVYNGSTYVQDPSDQQWIKYTAADAPSVLDIKKEFVTTGFKNDSGKNDQYFNKGTETVDGKDCYKYQVVDTDKPNQQGFMWFDKDSYLLRKLSNSDAGTELSMTFSYGKVSIDQPSPVKTMTQ